jgi:DNA-binding NarL/FixJ family response regulator
VEQTIEKAKLGGGVFRLSLNLVRHIPCHSTAKFVHGKGAVPMACRLPFVQSCHILDMTECPSIVYMGMSTKMPKKHTAVYIAGEDNSFHGALSYVFEKELCSKCIVLNNGESIPAEEISNNADGSLVLIDSMERDFEKELIFLGFGEGSQGGNMTVALFNVQKGTGIETRAFIKGIKGFFYRSDSLSQMLKGLRALHQGEVWISRDVLVRIAMESRGKKANTIREKTGLSRREIEILALVSIGSSNEEIADRLFIRPNTVKTHLYRIFQKIGVPNRFQAALWAAKNL